MPKPQSRTTRGPRPTLEGGQRRLFALVEGARYPGASRLGTVQGRPLKGSDAARSAKARGSGQVALWLERCASCKASRMRPRGPRPTSGGRLRRLFLLVYGARYPDAARLETVQGRPPKGEVGRGPARQRACHRARLRPLQSFARLVSPQTRATWGRVRPRGDARNDCSPWFLVRNTPTSRVFRRQKGVLPRVRGGPCPPEGPHRPPKRCRTRPGAPRRLIPGQVAPGSELCASCQLSTRRNKGPRPTSGGRLQRLSPLVYGASTSDVPRLEAVKGRPPKGARGTVAPHGAA